MLRHVQTGSTAICIVAAAGRGAVVAMHNGAAVTAIGAGTVTTAGRWRHILGKSRPMQLRRWLLCKGAAAAAAKASQVR